MDHPHLWYDTGIRNRFFFFGEARVEPGEVVSRANPHDAGKDVCPAEEQVEPLTQSRIKIHVSGSLTTNSRDKSNSCKG